MRKNSGEYSVKGLRRERKQEKRKKTKFRPHDDFDRAPKKEHKKNRRSRNEDYDEDYS